jgi:hypothetical protein
LSVFGPAHDTYSLALNIASAGPFTVVAPGTAVFGRHDAAATAGRVTAWPGSVAALAAVVPSPPTVLSAAAAAANLMICFFRICAAPFHFDGIQMLDTGEPIAADKHVVVRQPESVLLTNRVTARPD